jgi:hypothetical protein
MKKTPYGNVQETTINYEVASIASPTRAQPPTPMRLHFNNTEAIDSPPINAEQDHVYVQGKL